MESTDEKQADYQGVADGTMSSSHGKRQLALFDEPTPSVELPPRQGGVKYEGKTASGILMNATGFMDSYDFTLNPYSGCAFGCTYCYAAFFARDTDKRDTWGQWVDVKENAVDLLKRRQKSLHGKTIYMSTVTDPYQPIERKLEITRGLLRILAEVHAPKLVVQTRSPDVVRDLDLFHKIGERRGRVQVNLTVTTDDEDVRKAFEPSCPSNARRLEAARQLVDGGMDLDDEDGRPVLGTCITMTPLLLVRDAHRFAEDLLATGVRRFIVQPFHLRRGKFVAGTRDVALDMMAEKLSCGRHDLGDRYLDRYDEVHEVLDARLPELGKGKDGFKPPF